MKKLLIAMTAAAVGTCAWAEGEAGGEGDSTPAAPTMLNESFGADWTLQAPWSYWSGAETANPADGELTAGDALTLNTGSKVLRGNFMSNGSAKDIDTGLYFNATVTFKDPSDTLPTLGAQDKFALVVLDNVESIEEGYTATPATNLWVIAKYGESGQRAYQLDVEVDPTWLATDHKIVVKAYDNVMASGNCAGFLVMVDEIVCTVFQSCAIENNVINFGSFCRGNNFEDGAEYNLGYLGYPQTAILASVQKRYADAQLILSNVPGSDTLASVDFQGQGVIDDVSLATTGADFGADALVFTVEVSDGVTLTSDATVSYSAAGETKNITFTLAEGYVLKAPLAAVKGDNGVYTYAYTTVADNNQVVNIEAYEPAAYIGDTAYETFAAALAVGGEITLSKAITAADANVEGGFIDIAMGQTVTIDLNGNDIVDIVNAGNLTIKDSVGTGRVLENASISVSNDEGGTLTILGGCFEGAIKGATAKGISGGKFKNKTDLDEALADGLAFSAEATGGYYSVVEATVTPLPEITLPEDATAEDEKTAVETALGTQADAAVKANITNVTEYAEFRTWAGTVTGGATAVVNSPNAWTAYALDVPELVAEATELTDEDITVETFVQDATAEDAGTFAIEIKIKDHEIGSNAVVEKIKTVIDAEGAASLENGLAGFNKNNVDFDVTVSGGKAKLKVKAKNGGDKFFFKMKFK